MKYEFFTEYIDNKLWITILRNGKFFLKGEYFKPEVNYLREK